MHDTKKEYGAFSKVMHWLVGLTIIGLLIAGFVMINMPKSNLKWQIYAIHKATGISLIAFACIRIIWRIKQSSPELPNKYPKWQKIAARSTHGLLYILSIAMPFSGWVMSMAANHIPTWYGLFQLRLPIAQSKVLANLAAQTHEILAWVIIVLLTLHIAAAVANRSILKRMLPVCKKN